MNQLASIAPRHGSGLLTAVVCGAAFAWSPAASRADPRIPPLPAGPQVELVDGSVIAGRIVSCDDVTVGVESLDLGLVKLPRQVVSGWKASLAADRDRSQRPVALERITRDASPRAAGSLLLDNDDVATAQTLAVDGAAARIGIDGVAEPVTIPLGRIRAIEFVSDRVAAAGSGRPPVRLVAVRDGSRLAVEPLPPVEVAEGPTIRLVLAAREAKGLAVDCPREAIVATADRHAGVRSLEHEEIAGSGGCGTGDPPTDAYVPSRSVSGGPLRARGENAFGGFSMRPTGSVVFVLRPPADRFEGRMAIDDSAGGGGKVWVRLHAKTLDGDRATIFENGPIRGGEMPLAIAADHPGMEELEVEVEAERGDRRLDPVVWLDPVVIVK